jgi:choline-sulfatase
MAVRDKLKYVYVDDEAPQLFDLATDPHELVNRIDDPAYAERLAELKQIVHEGWDPDEIRERVIRSQRRRAQINEAMVVGRPDVGDVQPHFDAAEQYVRTQDSQATNAKMRYPRMD